MKTKIATKWMAMIAIFCFLGAGLNAKAQVTTPYSVANNLSVSAGCNMDINFTFYKSVGPNCIPCGSGSQIVAPGTSVNLPTPSGCPTVCNVSITVVKIGGVGTAPKTVNKNNPTANGTCTDCPCTIYNMSWATGQTQIF